MRKLIIVLWMITIGIGLTLQAQEGFNLPTELYVLLNEGRIERYGVNDDGVTSITDDSQFVLDFGLSPDGGWIAYRTLDGLFVAEALSGRGVLADQSPGIPPFRGDLPTVVWSPDGTAIAYTTEQGLRVYFRQSLPTPVVINVNDSVERLGFQQVRWSPDGSYLAATNDTNIWQIYSVADAQVSLAAVTPEASDLVWLTANDVVFAPVEGGLTQMNLASANRQTPIQNGARRYDVLTVRSNGEIAAFSRPQIGNRIPDGTGIYTLINPITNREDVIGESPVDLSGLRWAPDGEMTIAFRGGVLALVNPIDATGFVLPVTNLVAYSWGAQPLPLETGYPVTANLFFSAPDENGITQIWQLGEDGNAPLILTQATSDIRSYAVGPDGMSVAYDSERKLWLQRLNTGLEPLELTSLTGEQAASPSYRSDALALAYTDQSGIWVVSVDGGEPRALWSNTVSDTPQAETRVLTRPRYAPNTEALLVDVLYADGVSTGILDTISGELLELPVGFTNGEWLYDRRILTFGQRAGQNRSGVQITTLEQFERPEIILPDIVSVIDAVIIPRVGREDLRVIIDPGTADGPSPLRVFDFRDVAGLVPVLEQGFIEAPKLSPDGRFVAGYTRTRTAADGTLQGQLTLMNLNTGEQVAVADQRFVSNIQWQR